jgi:hypothetical protein
MEPLEPTASVNPEEVGELDEKTGKPVYEGKRLFLRYVEAFRSDGTLVHRGWKADSVRLPRLVRVEIDRLPTIAPAEVELK